MGKKILKCAGITTLILAFLLGAAYMGLARYYQNGFSYGTWINGIYCTGKTVEEVNEELLSDCSYDGLCIRDREGKSWMLEVNELEFSFDFRQSLQDFLEKQNPYLWMENLFSTTQKKLIPAISYDREKLNKELEKLPPFSDGRKETERDVYITKTDKGYMLVNERTGVLDRKAARQAVEQALAHLEGEVDLQANGCYVELTLTDEMRAELSEWEKVKTFQECGIIYQFGEEQVPVDASIVSDWIARDNEGAFLYDENGSLMADENKIRKFVETLADEFDTVGGVRHFKSTRGEMITVEGGTYGNRIDRKAEKEYLVQAFHNREKGLHTPEYVQKARKQGKNDIGDTYIEIDMSKQMMYYYEDRKLRLETPVVTGNTGRRMGTPAGVNFVYAKQENRVLRGQNYASHVNFWMPVKGNIGIHDAAWRNEYGGEIYMTNGSHGCINTPYDAMSELYGMVKTGTPVVMFY